MAVLSPATRRRRPGLWLVLLALLFGGGQSLSAQATKEYQVKAAFLFNFAQFIAWPGTVFTNTDAPFVIGILGSDPFGGALEDTVQGETVNSHKIVIERARTVADLKNCQLIFVSKSEKTISPRFCRPWIPGRCSRSAKSKASPGRGGIINFYLDGSKVRFEVNPAASGRDGLESQLAIVEPRQNRPAREGGQMI